MDYEEIKKLIEDMGNSKLDTLEIEFPDGCKISMSKNKPMHAESVTTSNVANVQKEISVVEESKTVVNAVEKNIADLKIIKSPMVGTFYTSASPKDEPFVKVGDKVKKGQVVCIVEAMKLMNEIESEFDGEVVEICVNNEDVVEYGLPLFKLK